jgi:hypothetical protein
MGLPVTRPALVTAPHHGSRTNDHGYQVLADWLQDDVKGAIFVRNGGSHVKALSAFLEMPQRLCVKCHKAGDDPEKAARLVRLEAKAGRWEFPAHPVFCHCKA